MINLDYVYRGTCCVCCGIPQISSKYFQTFNGKLVLHTVDHDLLRSLGGSNSVDNLNSMCYDCNHMRGNMFAELQQFLDWYNSGEEYPKFKNFSYLYENPNRVRARASVVKKEVTAPVLVSQNKSVPTRIVVIKGIQYQEYTHPMFGKSLIQVKDC